MQNLRKIRREKGLTQIELAKKAGISQMAIRKYEAGACPKLKTAQKIAAVLEVAPSDLYSTVSISREIDDLSEERNKKLEKYAYGSEEWNKVAQDYDVKLNDLQVQLQKERAAIFLLKETHIEEKYETFDNMDAIFSYKNPDGLKDELFKTFEMLSNENQKKLLDYAKLLLKASTK